MQEELKEIKKSLEGLLLQVNSCLFVNKNKEQMAEIVINSVCLHGGITPEILLTQDRNGKIIACRKIASYVLMDYCGWSSYRTATRLNLHARGAVLNHRNRMREWMKTPLYMPIETLEMTEKVLIDSGYEKK